MLEDSDVDGLGLGPAPARWLKRLIAAVSGNRPCGRLVKQPSNS